MENTVQERGRDPNDEKGLVSPMNEDQLIIEDNLFIRESLFVFIEDTSILSHTLLIGANDLASLTSSKEANIEKNIVLFTNLCKWEISSSFINWNELKTAYDNKYFVKIEIPSMYVNSPLLKIINLRVDNNLEKSYSISLEEICQDISGSKK